MHWEEKAKWLSDPGRGSLGTSSYEVFACFRSGQAFLLVWQSLYRFDRGQFKELGGEQSELQELIFSSASPG